MYYVIVTIESAHMLVDLYAQLKHLVARYRGEKGSKLEDDKKRFLKYK